MTETFKSFAKKYPVPLYAGTLVAFLLGILIGTYAADNPSLSPGGRKQDCLSNLAFINPEPDCDTYEDKLNRIQALQSDLNRTVSAYLNTGRASRVSVFVRDLTSQRFASVDDSDTFAMASLLKVPLAIAYFRLAEITPDLLSQKLPYTAAQNLYSSQLVAPPRQLTLGESYSVSDLIYAALAYSDNSAAEILSENFVSYDYLQKVLPMIGLQPKKSSDKEYNVTARSYAGLFRILYNSSFLTRKYSDQVLKILADSSFTEGATAELPTSVKVSHKFGERTVLDSMTGEVATRQLHDCGIVYAGKGTDPYTYCIMTEGKDLANLKSIIQNTSLVIYKGMED